VPTEWIAPTITGVLAAATAIVAGVIAIRNTRAGAREQRAPSVTEAWSAADRARDVWYELLDMFYELLRVFRNYVRRAQESGGPELTEDEKAALQMRPPSIEREKEKS
jgi:hypothetical protein